MEKNSASDVSRGSHGAPQAMGAKNIDHNGKWTGSSAADCRPWAACQPLASSKADGRGRVEKEGVVRGFPNRH